MYTSSLYATRRCEWCGCLLYWDEDVFCNDRECINDYFDYLWYWGDEDYYV